IVWGQRGNFLHVPTDCPQRDERLGWTGDAQAFIRTASYFFDVERFFRKWLHDMAADQYASGEVGQVIPDVMPQDGSSSAAWGDAATICPWQIYQTYGDLSVLEDQFGCMKNWVDYITSATTTKDLWTGHFHFGDWLGLDAPSGSYKGSSREDFIATAFYAHSAALVVKAGRLLGKDVTAYEALHDRIVSAFRAAFPTCQTQTEYTLKVHFDLCEDKQQTADALAERVRADGKQLRTGFVGTPYLLHVLSQYGHADLAWDLLLRREYPGWLYPVTKGATTVWEHWDGIKEDGSFWSTDMNSYNHYAYGAVADWVFEQAAGLRHAEDQPGFSELIYAPHPDPRIGWLQARLDTRHGTVRALWVCEEDGVRYELTTPVRTKVCLGGKAQWVNPGQYTFWTKNEE
ncbi:MAG: alfa-L-rhamnosidase, partial [Clostridia bacterium]|nr:alfa-L-rhamnosidase [Clostridia bacterium]